MRSGNGVLDTVVRHVRSIFGHSQGHVGQLAARPCPECPECGSALLRPVDEVPRLVCSGCETMWDIVE
jgi:hypothetical protein